MPLPFASPFYDNESGEQLQAGDAAAGGGDSVQRMLNQRYMFAWAIYTYLGDANPMPSMRAADLYTRLHHGLMSVRNISQTNTEIAANVALNVLSIARELMIEMVMPTVDDDMMSTTIDMNELEGAYPNFGPIQITEEEEEGL